MQLPIGYDNFGEIRDKHLDFVDKTRFIQAILNEITTQVIVITRPRRFGKTLNLSMLQHFLAAKVYGRDTQQLFNDLYIARAGEQYQQHQGRYPVIFISLKDVQDHTFPHAVAKFKGLMARVYAEHAYLLTSDKLRSADRKFIDEVLERKIDDVSLEEALCNLTRYLAEYHGIKPWLLIDEYDTPLQSAFLHNYYNEMVSLLRGVFSTALKTNPYLEKSVITGILRIAKESLFSGLNNLKVYTLLQSAYSEYFGFTEQEIAGLLTQAGLLEQAQAIRHWYNGYLAGDTVIYNPWSIVNCIQEKGALRPYWVNTSGNELIRRLLARSDTALKTQMELLLAGQPVAALIDENIVFGDLERNHNAIWSLMLFSGYVKATAIEPFDTYAKVQLLPPNYEIFLLYRSLIQDWFSAPLGQTNYQSFLNSLTQGNIEEFILRLQDCLLETFSIFDVTGRYPEKFYHGFVLGMMVSLRDTHEVQSNQESGYGRYDVMLIPKDRTQLGIVMEFKTVPTDEVPLAKAAEQALAQIVARRYAATLQGKGVERIVQLGLAFHGKNVAVAVSDSLIHRSYSR